MKEPGMIKLLLAYFTNVRDKVARNGKRKPFNIKLEILNAMMNAPMLKPIRKKARRPTLPMYSGSKKRKGIPNRFAMVSVIKPKSNSQYNIIT